MEGGEEVKGEDEQIQEQVRIFSIIVSGLIHLDLSIFIMCISASNFATYKSFRHFLCKQNAGFVVIAVAVLTRFLPSPELTANSQPTDLS